MTPVDIIVADRQGLVADGLRYRLADHSDYRIVGHVCSGKGLLEWLGQYRAHLALVEVSLPDQDGIDTMRTLRKEYPEVRVLAHSSLTEIEYVNSMLIEGAHGYLVKGGERDELIEALRTVMNGKCYISPAAQENIAKGYTYTDKRMDGEYLGLVPREREVIKLIALEYTSEEIADSLCVSVETVKTHRKNLMRKLNVRSAAGLAKYARDRCWV